MSGLDWLLPAAWPLVLVVPVLALVGVRAEGRRRQRQRAAFGRRTDAVLGRPWAVRRRAIAAVAGAVCCAIALLQPLAGTSPSAPPQPQVVLCLDLSRSMLARDLRPDRLSAAQQDIAALVEVAAGAQVGLVAFAGTAEWIAPRTEDVHSVAQLARALDPSRPRRGGTDLGAAIDLALRGLPGSAAAEHAAIVLLTDGEHFGPDVLAAVQRARSAGVSVSAVAYGSDGGSKIVIAGDDGEVFLRDSSGQEVVTVPDRAALSELARAGDGVFALGDGEQALVRLFTDELRPRAARAAYRDPSREPPHAFQWPLLLGVLLSMLAVAMPERRR